MGLLLLLVLLTGLLLVPVRPLPKAVATGGNTQPAGKTFFFGDSRTVGMCCAVRGASYCNTLERAIGNEVWIAKVGSGYDFMTGTAIPHAENYGIGSGSTVFFLFGVNDLHNASRYASAINQKASAWRSRGARVYFVSVNPVNDSKTKYVKNAQIESFNRSVRSSLSSNVTYVDTYSRLYNQIAFDDSMTDSEGLHYYSATYKSIYQMLPSGTRYSYSY